LYRYVAVPLIIYSGHTDLVRSIVYVPGKRQYFSAGWDKTIRVWFAPNHGAKKQSARSSDGGGVAALAAAAPAVAVEESEVGLHSLPGVR
jgi:WD40 repeat protein